MASTGLGVTIGSYSLRAVKVRRKRDGGYVVLKVFRPRERRDPRRGRAGARRAGGLRSPGHRGADRPRRDHPLQPGAPGARVAAPHADEVRGGRGGEPERRGRLRRLPEAQPPRPRGGAHGGHDPRRAGPEQVPGPAAARPRRGGDRGGGVLPEQRGPLQRLRGERDVRRERDPPAREHRRRGHGHRHPEGGELLFARNAAAAGACSRTPSSRPSRPARARPTR